MSARDCFTKLSPFLLSYKPNKWFDYDRMRIAEVANEGPVFTCSTYIINA